MSITGPESRTTCPSVTRGRNVPVNPTWTCPGWRLVPAAAIPVAKVWLYARYEIVWPRDRARTWPFIVTPESEYNCVTLPKVVRACTAGAVPLNGPDRIDAPKDIGVDELRRVGTLAPAIEYEFCPLFVREKLSP